MSKKINRDEYLYYKDLYNGVKFTDSEIKFFKIVYYDTILTGNSLSSLTPGILLNSESSLLHDEDFYKITIKSNFRHVYQCYISIDKLEDEWFLVQYRSDETYYSYCKCDGLEDLKDTLKNFKIGNYNEDYYYIMNLFMDYRVNKSLISINYNKSKSCEDLEKIGLLKRRNYKDNIFYILIIGLAKARLSMRVYLIDNSYITIISFPSTEEIIFKIPKINDLKKIIKRFK